MASHTSLSQQVTSGFRRHSGQIVDTNLGGPGEGWISPRLEDRKVETMSALRQCWLTGDRTLSMSNVVVAGLGESALVGEDHPLGTVA